MIISFYYLLSFISFEGLGFISEKLHLRASFSYKKFSYKTGRVYYAYYFEMKGPET